jgi:hypothetical protein
MNLFIKKKKKKTSTTCPQQTKYITIWHLPHFSILSRSPRSPRSHPWFDSPTWPHIKTLKSKWVFSFSDSHFLVLSCWLPQMTIFLISLSPFPQFHFSPHASLKVSDSQPQCQSKKFAISRLSQT